MHAIIAHRTGGPEVLELSDAPGPRIRPDQVLVRVAAAGVNFVDTYRRSGVYPADLPQILGVEGAGTVVAVGDDVADFSHGDRVAWLDAPGSYAELVAVDAARAVRVPDAVPLETAAAALLQGLTAHYLCTSTAPVSTGDHVVVHAGAGGVGLLLTQMAASRGAHVVTTVSTAAKEDLSRAAGAADVVRYTELRDLTAELPPLLRASTGGRGVDVVYDSVGRSTFDASLASLRPRGTLVLFGGASGQVPPFDLQRLNSAGSLYVTRPTLADYVATRAELLWRAREVLTAVADGSLSVRVGATYPLARADEAHRALEARETTGKVVLVP